MAARNYDTQRVLGKGLVTIAGSFAPNGSSAISASSRQGQGWSVARTGTGQYTLTLTDKYTTLVSYDAGVQLATPADIKIQLTSETVSSTKTVVFTSLAVATATDIAANAGNRVHFRLLLRNTSSTPVRG